MKDPTQLKDHDSAELDIADLESLAGGTTIPAGNLPHHLPNVP